MTITTVQIFRLSFELTRALPVRGSIATRREVLRIVVNDSERGLRFADCAPLAGLHSETLDDCLTAAKAYFSGSRPDELPVSLQTAIAIIDAEIPEVSAGKSRFENCALVRLTPDLDIRPLLKDLEPARVIKVKAGAEAWARLPAFLAELVTSRSDREIRVDCNEALALYDPIDIVRMAEDLPIRWLEEPTRNLADLGFLARHIPIALDENLGRDYYIDAAAAAWVLKPNVIGWTSFIARLKAKHAPRKVLSNAFESPEMLQLYASVYRSLVPAAERVACGFGTAYYFAETGESWNARTYEGPWPHSPLAPYQAKGDLLWTL